MFQTPDKTHRARRLRSDMTHAERLLWEMVRNRKLDGWKFRRQTVVAGRVVDFFCPELGLVIELDGGVHRLTEAADAERDRRMAEAGFHIVRLSNEAFLHNPNGLKAVIVRRAAEMEICPPHPTGSASHLLPPRGEGDLRDLV